MAWLYPNEEITLTALARAAIDVAGSDRVTVLTANAVAIEVPDDQVTAILALLGVGVSDDPEPESDGPVAQTVVVGEAGPETVVPVPAAKVSAKSATPEFSESSKDPDVGAADPPPKADTSTQPRRTRRKEG